MQAQTRVSRGLVSVGDYIARAARSSDLYSSSYVAAVLIDFLFYLHTAPQTGILAIGFKIRPRTSYNTHRHRNRLHVRILSILQHDNIWQTSGITDCGMQHLAGRPRRLLTVHRHMSIHRSRRHYIALHSARPCSLLKIEEAT